MFETKHVLDDQWADLMDRLVLVGLSITVLAVTLMVLLGTG
jgi:hypothetical protein